MSRVNHQDLYDILSNIKTISYNQVSKLIHLSLFTVSKKEIANSLVFLIKSSLPVEIKLGLIAWLGLGETKSIGQFLDSL